MTRWFKSSPGRIRLRLSPADKPAGIATRYLCLLALAMVLSAHGASASIHVKVKQVGTALSIHMRSGPSNKSKVLAYIPPGTVIEAIEDCNDKWCKVNFKNMSGWVFTDYLEETKEAITEIKAPEQAQDQPDHPTSAAPVVYKAAPANPTGALQVQEFPGASMPIIGSIPGNATGIQDLGRCVLQWCRVKYRQLEGWALREELKTDDSAQPASLPQTGAVPPLPGPGAEVVQATLLTAKPKIDGGEKTPAPPEEQHAKPVVHKVELGIAGLNASGWLPLREKPEETSRVVGVLASNASGIEDMKECVRQWCRVRYEGASGFVLRRFLTTAVEGDVTRYHVDGIEMDEALKVFDFPGKEAQIVGSIPSYASGIVRIGDCDSEWCHIRYLGLVGWVGTANLAADAAPHG